MMSQSLSKIVQKIDFFNLIKKNKKEYLKIRIKCKNVFIIIERRIKKIYRDLLH
jgi:hypothetical protein